MNTPTGKTLGRYQLLEAIQESGEFLVYRGFQPSANRYVAVRVLKPGAARSPGTAQQFEAAGRLVARLQLPGDPCSRNAGGWLVGLEYTFWTHGPQESQ